MTNSFNLVKSLAVGGFLAAGTLLFADGTRFSDFAALPSSAGPTADESQPITFGTDAFQQRSIVDRASQLAANTPTPATST